MYIYPPRQTIGTRVKRTRETTTNSGGTVASILDMCEQLWAGGKAMMKKVNDPLLLAVPPSDGGVTFKEAGSPGGLGYDSLEKCEQKGGKPCLHYGLA